MNSVRVEFWAEPAQASAWSIFNTCLGGINGESLSDDPLTDGSPLQGHVLVSKLDDGLPKVGATVQMRLKKAAVFRGDATDYEADFLIPK